MKARETARVCRPVAESLENRVFLSAALSEQRMWIGTPMNARMLGMEGGGALSLKEYPVILNAVRRMSDPRYAVTVDLSKQYLAGTLSRTVQVRAGGTLVVRLKANATTPVKWVLSKAAPSRLPQAGESVYISDPNPHGMAGVGGVEVFTFRARQKGQAQITLNYRPLFGGSPVATLKLTVQVV